MDLNGQKREDEETMHFTVVFIVSFKPDFSSTPYLIFITLST